MPTDAQDITRLAIAFNNADHLSSAGLDVISVHIGTCYCPNANFGKSYCRMEPRWYHNNGRGRAYAGDRHPDAMGRPYPDEMYDPTPRACDCCGTVTKVFKKEYRDPWVWH